MAHGFERKWNSPVRIGKEVSAVKEYREWSNIQTRCTPSGDFQKEKPTYVGCYRDEVFSSYDLYYEWRNNQVGAGQKDEKGHYFATDKDLLKPGNKCYGVEFVVFIPLEINGFLIRRNSARSKYGKGVYKTRSGNYTVCVSAGTFDTAIYLGTFCTINEAKSVYYTAKNHRAKELAEKWRGRIDDRAYQALINYDEELMCLIDEL